MDKLKTFRNPSQPRLQKNTTSFSGFIENLIAGLNKANRPGTALNYQRARNSFSAYLGYRDIPLSGIDRELICAYEQWLKTKGVSRNTISFYMRILRAIFNKAAESGLVPPEKPFARVYTGIERTRKRAVDGHTVTRLKNLDLRKSPSLAYARDLFIFSFYTRGMAFIDLAYLRKENIRNGILRYNRSKTGQVMHIRLEPCMQEIIDRYAAETRSSEYVFPLITAGPPSAAYRQYQNALNHYNKKLRKISKILELEPPLSSYVARHTWATVARNINIPLSVISEGMGHNSEQTTRIYLASLEQNIIDNANLRILNALLL